jgi:hypothetical protein
MIRWWDILPKWLHFCCMLTTRLTRAYFCAQNTYTTEVVPERHALHYSWDVLKILEGWREGMPDCRAGWEWGSNFSDNKVHGLTYEWWICKAVQDGKGCFRWRTASSKERSIRFFRKALQVIWYNNRGELWENRLERGRSQISKGSVGRAKGLVVNELSKRMVSPGEDSSGYHREDGCERVEAKGRKRALGSCGLPGSH